jgi:adenylate cyclase
MEGVAAMGSPQRERVERRLVAILAADIVGYSRLMAADEEGTLRRLKALHQGLAAPKIAAHNGRIVKTLGDGMLVEFASVVDAVRCAVEIQQAVRERDPDVAAADRMELRIGINLGDAIVEGGDLYGDSVNVASRIEALADPGGVLVANTVHDHVHGRLPYVFEDLGEHRVKNITRPVRIFRVELAGKAPLKPFPPLPDKPSLAVLAFENMTGDAGQDYFVDGIVEEIITAISRLHWLFVIARNSSFVYKGRAVDIKQVARELGVRYVLEGSVRKSAARVRISGQLIDAVSGAHIWADRFDGAIDDIFDLQDQVAKSVVGAIEPKLRQSEIERAIHKTVERLDAHDLYLRALGKFHQHAPDALREAIGLLRQALAVDPAYAPAAALIGECRVVQGAHGWETVSAEERAESVRLAKLALRSGSDDPDVLWMAAFSLSIFAREHDQAMSLAERALALNPNSARAWETKGWVDCHQNRPSPAIEAFEQAIRLSPLDPLSGYFEAGLALAKLLAGEYEDAWHRADQALRKFPRYAAALRIKAASCGYLGRLDEAREAVNRVLDLQPGLTVRRWLSLTSFPQDVAALCADGLRRAGLPEG